MPITAVLIAVYHVLQLDACCCEDGKEEMIELLRICKLMLNSDPSQVNVKARSSVGDE